ncbi:MULTISPECIES: FAD-dependent oxidoreductase [unclassified Streptomyces]|uniref:FAD-dependent oxidoreductase n=1 Tax=unclassified Streptomyces TaxID=2593676 RepID=UPI002DD9152D|nr:MULTISPECIES: FAD-dependent oxidoreductase [unclassified Streptomyces]
MSNRVTGVTKDSFAWIRGAGGHWPGGAQDLREYAMADYRRLENELPHLTLRRTGSLTWADTPAQDTRPGPSQFRIGRSDIAALEPNLRHPPDQAIHTPSDAGVDPTAMTHALAAAAGAHGATVLHNTAVTSLQVAGGHVDGVLTSTGLHAATTIVLTAGVPKLCEPLSADLAIAASPATLARVTAPPGLVKTIMAGPGFEVREVRDGDLLLVVPHVEGTAAAREQAAQDAFQHLQATFQESDQCRLLIDGASGLDVDHRVPLAEAWDSGASNWTAAERQAYANDRALIAVSAKSNRSKADQDPATWMPPAESDHCDYARDWIVVKVRWQLAIDPAEQTALSEDLTHCPNAPVKVTLAR